ncbi:MAG: sialate O-acetylesterase, partial [Oscillospiraceae bacterium]|nr:sialate O-acetylesterase [Oscillospiraceae bacterium]
AGGQTYRDIYVGDVWILGGQSNMEGVGWLTAEDEQFAKCPDSDVRALYMDDTWGPACHPLHNLGIAVDGVHAALGAGPRPMFNSAGPGLEFALKMKALTGVPQGVLCCAHGGTSMEQWSPAKKTLGGSGSLYGAMLRRFLDNGAHVRGMFWYQGCSDAGLPMCDLFLERMKEFVFECRSDFGKQLPFVQAQIGRRYVDLADKDSPMPDCWTAVREHQRVLHTMIPDLYTVSAVDKDLDDLIHLSSPAQKKLGAEAAEAMYCLLYKTDEKGCLPPPVFAGLRVCECEKTGLANVELRCINLHGGLVSKSRPAGFMITQPSGAPFAQYIFDTRLSGDTILLRTMVTPQAIAGCRLYYAYGIDPYCNITDMAERAIPAMGPVYL